MMGVRPGSRAGIGGPDQSAVAVGRSCPTAPARLPGPTQEHRMSTPLTQAVSLLHRQRPIFLFDLPNREPVGVLYPCAPGVQCIAEHDPTPPGCSPPSWEKLYRD